MYCDHHMITERDGDNHNTAIILHYTGFNFSLSHLLNFKQF